MDQAIGRNAAYVAVIDVFETLGLDYQVREEYIAASIHEEEDLRAYTLNDVAGFVLKLSLRESFQNVDASLYEFFEGLVVADRICPVPYVMAGDIKEFISKLAGERASIFSAFADDRTAFVNLDDIEDDMLAKKALSRDAWILMIHNGAMLAMSDALSARIARSS